MTPLRVVDLTDPPDGPDRVAPDRIVVAIGDPNDPAAEYWLQKAIFTLTDQDCDDRRTVSVASVTDTLALLTDRCRRWPHAASVCDDVLRTVDVEGPALPGVITESLAYSTLQGGPEFARWLDERGPARPVEIPDPVLARRDGNTLEIRFNRPQRHNAFSTDARAALLPLRVHPDLRVRHGEMRIFVNPWPDDALYGSVNVFNKLRDSVLVAVAPAADCEHRRLDL